MRVAMLLAGGAGLSACVVGPDYHRPEVTLSQRWGSSSEAHLATAPDLSRWWQRLGDPTLDALIDEAVLGNLDVATAKAKIRQARASYKEAGGVLLPAVEATASATRSRSTAGSGAVAGAFSDEQNQFQAGFDASWEADLFGANRRSLEAARYGLDAAQEDLRATLLTLVGDVAQNYLEARGYQARIDLGQRTAAAQRETAALTESKFRNGSASAVDVAKAAGLASSTEAQVQALQSAYAQDVHRLSVLLGREPAALSAKLAFPAPVPDPPGLIPIGVPADVLRARPDVRRAERQLAQSTAKIGVAEAARYPSVSLTGSIATSGAKPGDLAKASSISWSFGPSLTIPIFQGGQLEAAVELAQAQRDQSYLGWRAAVLTALEDVEDASVALNQERSRKERLAESAKAYGEAARLASALYRSGSTGSLEVLDAERSLYSAEDSLVASQVAVATDYVALNKALGGGWDGAVDASLPEVADSNTGPHLSPAP
ncbi:efflux transporter outer membrane subunit [Nevskia soli]|uniref:efflux transporter outer membrane subunit n=1 Tax=Nevskia soli TaxID=418856 RepID=UPI000569F9FA